MTELKSAKELYGDRDYNAVLARRSDKEDRKYDSEWSEEQRKDAFERSRANEKKMFLPEFIPYNPILRIKYGFSHMDVLVFGFIRFYLLNLKKLNIQDKGFFFTDEQLADLFKVSKQTIQNSISNVRKQGFITTQVKTYMGGGSIRKTDLTDKGMTLV